MVTRSFEPTDWVAATTATAAGAYWGYLDKNPEFLPRPVRIITAPFGLLTGAIIVGGTLNPNLRAFYRGIYLGGASTIGWQLSRSFIP